jgi:hypothetical protein
MHSVDRVTRPLYPNIAAHIRSAASTKFRTYLLFLVKKKRIAKKGALKHPNVKTIHSKITHTNLLRRFAFFIVTL